MTLSLMFSWCLYKVNFFEIILVVLGRHIKSQIIHHSLTVNCSNQNISLVKIGRAQNPVTFLQRLTQALSLSWQGRKRRRESLASMLTFLRLGHISLLAHARQIFKMAEAQQPLPKRHDLQTSADLERVTDYAEEKEISTTDIENVSGVTSTISAD